MKTVVNGLHHVTAFASKPQELLEFYRDGLGLRLVKLTVNYDDPTTYHLYFTDAHGSPGTVLTFFPWPDAQPGRRGPGQAVAIAMAVPGGSLDWWRQRLTEKGVLLGGLEQRPHGHVLSFRDPDGLLLELVERDVAALPPEASDDAPAPIPSAYAIRGLAGVTLAVNELEPTARVLTDVLGATPLEGDARFESGGMVIELAETPGMRGRFGPGTVHHIAWRVTDDAAHAAVREQVTTAGLDVTPVIDRTYFHSIYFREPGGVIFEVATDNPGFAVDEPAETMGSRLVLPAHLEPNRAQLEAVLPELELRTQPQVG